MLELKWVNRMKNKGLNVLLYILLLILLVIIIILLLFKFDILKNNNNTNNSSNKTSESSKKVEEADTSKNIDENNSKTSSSGPAETEKEENIKEKIDNKTVNLKLLGDEEIYLNVGEDYIDEGVVATDSGGNDVSDKITIDNNVNTTEKGEYMVIYSYGKSIVIRKVIVK